MVPLSPSSSGTAFRVASTLPPSDTVVASNPAQEVPTPNAESPLRLNLTVPLELPKGPQSPNTSPLNLIAPLELPESPQSALSDTKNSPFSLTVPSKLRLESPPSLSASPLPSMLEPSELPEPASPDPQFLEGIDLPNSDEMSSVAQIVEIGNDALLAYDAFLLKSQQLRSTYPLHVPVQQGVMANGEGEELREPELNSEPNDGMSIRSQSPASTTVNLTEVI